MLPVSKAQRDVVVCRCEAVSLGEIVDAIAAGCRSPLEIKIRTRAGMGICQGRTCRATVAALTAAATGADVAEVEPFTCRHPARPVPMAELAAGYHEEGGLNDGR